MKNWRQLLVIMLASTIPALAHAERIKDITSISGVRSNQLIGYGLVVGLDGTGDKAPFTTQTFRNMMNEFERTPDMLVMSLICSAWARAGIVLTSIMTSN